MKGILSEETVQILISEGFKPYPKDKPLYLYCNSKAWTNIYGSERIIDSEYFDAYNTVIHRSRIIIADGTVSFSGKREEPLEGIYAAASYEGVGGLPSVCEVLEKHISSLIGESGFYVAERHVNDRNGNA